MKKIISLCLIFLFLAGKNFSQNSSPPLAKGEERFINKPKLTRGPYLQAATDSSIVIRWRTDVSVRARVRHGVKIENLPDTTDDVILKTEHEIKLTGLKPATRYFYSIGTLRDTLQYGPNNYFFTLPVPGTEGHYRVGVFGDCGSPSVNQLKVRDEFIKYLGNNNLDAWILLGDNAYNDGNDKEYQVKFFNSFQDYLLKKYPVFPGPGNHDYHDADFGAEYAQKTHSTAYFQNFTMPINGEAGGIASHNPAFYSFDLGNIHFISLDSYGMEENKYFLYDTLGPQAQWLIKDLKANQNKGWVIVYFHHPPYSKGTHDSDTDDIMSGIRMNILPILDRYEVDLVISGHSHVYERSRLLKGYYGKTESFDTTKYQLSNSSGLYNGSPNSAPYIKEPGPHNGIVYVVSGTASYVGKAAYEFPTQAMYYSNDSDAGAGMLEVRGNRLDFKWICADGIIRDQFTMMKNINKKTTIHLQKGKSITLTASFVGDYEWNNKQNSKSITVSPQNGLSTFTVRDKYHCIQDTFKIIVSK